MHLDSFLWKGPNKDGPAKAELEATLAKYPTAAGLGTYLDGELKGDLVEGATVDMLLATLAQFKDTGIMVHFSNYPEKFKAEDKQPFCVLKNGNKELVLAFIQGAFPAFAKDDGHSSAYHFALTQLQPLMADLWQDAKTMENLKKALNGAVIRRTMQGFMAGPSNVALMLANGEEPLMFSKDQAPTKTEYGWTTDLVKVGTFPAEEKKPSNKAGFVRAAPVKAAPPPEEPKEPEEPDDDDAPAPLEPDDDGDEAVVVNGGETAQLVKDLNVPINCIIKDGQVWFHPPTNVHGNELKQMYRRVAGFLPSKEDYGHWKHKRPDVPVKPEKLKGFDKLALIQRGPELKLRGEPKTPVTEGKVEANPKAPAKSEEQSYVLDPKVIAKIDKHLKHPRVVDILDEYQNHMMSPQALESMEKKLPNFTDNFKMKLEDTFRWTIPFMLEAVPDLHAMAVLAASYRLALLKRLTADEWKTLNANVPKDNKKDDAVQRRSAGFAKTG